MKKHDTLYFSYPVAFKSEAKEPPLLFLLSDQIKDDWVALEATKAPTREVLRVLEPSPDWGIILRSHKSTCKNVSWAVYEEAGALKIGLLSGK